MKKCPSCARLFHDNVASCPVDGHALAAVSAQERAQILNRRNNPRTTNSFQRNQPNAAQRQMIIGALWCIGGIAVTAATYSAASGPGGGSYVVAWGAILFGGLQFVRGFVVWSQNRGQSASYDVPVTSPPAARAEKTVWTCSKCGEQSLPQTAACWKCGAPRSVSSR